MDDSTKERVVEKAEYVRDAVEVLSTKRDSLTLEAYRSRREQRDIVEREFQTAIEACIDIGEMVLRSNGYTVPDTNAGVFRRLGNKGVLTDDTAERMSRAAGLRNVLSHQYGPDIDDEDVFNALQTQLDAFPVYLTEIRDRSE